MLQANSQERYQQNAVRCSFHGRRVFEVPSSEKDRLETYGSSTTVFEFSSQVARTKLPTPREALQYRYYMTSTIKYTFEFEDGSSWVYDLHFDAEHFFIPKIDVPRNEWTELGFQQCPNCPLKTADCAQCPVARNLHQVVEDSKATLSVKRAKVRVETSERHYEKECATQEGLRSLFGVVMASSGCPHLDWLRPLARFHLPFSDTDETLFRVLSLEALKSFFSGKEVSLDSVSKKIGDRYKEVETVNHSFVKRIRTYCQADADKNAIAALDVFVQMFPYQMQSDFGSLRVLFTEKK